jgi:hypothetical protein
MWAAQDSSGHAREAALAPLVEALEHEGKRREDALKVLAMERDPSIQAIADQTVRRLMDKGSLTVNYNICHYVEMRLWRSTVANDDLVALVRRVIVAPAGTGRMTLANPLTSTEALSEDEAQRTILLQEFIDAPGDPEALVLVAENIVSDIDGQSSADASLPVLQEIMTQLDRLEADHLLFRSAQENGDFAEALSRWLTSKQFPPPGKFTKRLRKQVTAGDAPREAVDLIWRKEMGRYMRKQSKRNRDRG